MHTNPCSLCTHFCSIGVKFTSASDVWCRCFWRQDYDTVKNSELPRRCCSSANMAGRLLLFNISLDVQNISMWEPLVSMHMWKYSCIMWQSTVARCALLKHAFHGSIWTYIPFNLTFMYDLCGFCLFVTVPYACFYDLEKLSYRQLCKTGKVWELTELRESVWLNTLRGIKAVKSVYCRVFTLVVKKKSLTKSGKKSYFDGSCLNMCT